MKKIFSAIAFLVSITVFAQPVPRRTVVEHFTNTYCPPCANRNPDLYANLAAHPSVYHVSYHPSSPYPSCTLYQHNPSENDARTNYYSVYGSTPRIVLQGMALPSNVNFADTALFSAAMGVLVPFDMTVSLTQINATTLRVTVNISKEDASALTDAGLYGVIAEDTLVFTTNNGEPAHYDVFRKAVWSANPQSTPLPVTVGNSVSLMQDVTINNGWDLSKVYAMVMLHDSLDVIQVARSSGLTLGAASIAGEQAINIHPNPAEDQVTLSGLGNGAEISLTDLNGRQFVARTTSSQSEILDISSLSSGLYIISVSSSAGVQRMKLLKK